MKLTGYKRQIHILDTLIFVPNYSILELFNQFRQLSILNFNALCVVIGIISFDKKGKKFEFFRL